MIETSQLITLAVCCGYVSNLIGRITINIPEIILGVHGLTLHTVKFELTNQHSVGGKNCGVLTSCRFCALRFDFCVISESLYCGDAVLFQRFLQINHLPYFNLLKSQLFAIIWAGRATRIDSILFSAAGDIATWT